MAVWAWGDTLLLVHGIDDDDQRSALCNLLLNLTLANLLLGTLLFDPQDVLSEVDGSWRKFVWWAFFPLDGGESRLHVK